MEGGRSRSGKLMPPRFGMLGYVVDSVRRNKADDLYIVPTSIAYDQIQDVADYASEASGREKDKETFRWALKAIRSLRRRYGNIHIRFADPISVSKELDPDAGPEEVSLRLQKLAFEVMYRIGRVTPFTPTSVVAIALLSGRGAGLTTAQLAVRSAELDAYIDAHDLPTTEELRLDDPVEVRAVLFELGDHGSVSSYDRGATPVFFLTPEQALQAAYYRNTVVHYFVPGAIAELALLAAGPGEETFWDEVWRLRDLLKFEFFFSEREQFRAEIAVELAAADPAWEPALADPAERLRLLERMRPLRAHWSLLPFLEAYQIVADQLVDTIGEPDEKHFLSSCLGRGRQYRIQGTVGADESVSLVLFKAALSLAANRDLLGGAADGARRAFSAEVADARTRAVRVAQVAEQRLASETAAAEAAGAAADSDGD
jgi:glycerol-3-phosphate O-acyltransferase